MVFPTNLPKIFPKNPSFNEQNPPGFVYNNISCGCGDEPSEAGTVSSCLVVGTSPLTRPVTVLSVGEFGKPPGLGPGNRWFKSNH